MLQRLTLASALLALALTTIRAQTPEWIWSAAPPDPEEIRVFRKSFTVPAGITKAVMTVAADNDAEVRLDGALVAKNESWSSPTRVTLKELPAPGTHQIEVQASNDGGAAALLFLLELSGPGETRQVVASDGTWQVAPETRSGWQAVKSFGKLGVSPWGDVPLIPAATASQTLQVASGFRVDLIRSAETGEGSWVSMTTDPQGRLLLSPQGKEPLLRVTLDAQGQISRIEPIPVPVRGAMGLLCAFGALYANAEGPDGYHLYRITDSNGDDQYDRVELLHRWDGGPGEHGAHGIVRGPDDLLYIVNGNFVDVPRDLGPGSAVRHYADDLALPRMEDGNGFGAGRKPPGGYVVRMDRDGRNVELYSAGERNTYDLAFSPEGELFGFDSDMEWDWGTPWYRPTRVYHMVRGGDQGFREGSAKWPEEYADSLPAVVNIGIGSPTGVCFGTGTQFPPRFRQALYVADWSYGRILAVFLKPNGASFTGSFETFVKGKPLNVSDITVGSDGALYFITGGRGTHSGLYRVTYTGPADAPAVASDPDAAAARDRRHVIERFLGAPDPSAVDAVWPDLSSPDRHLRFAARVALEAQPVASWRDRALSETNARAGLTALLALARVGSGADQAALLKTVARWPLDSLDEEWKLNKLRVITVSASRHGIPEEIVPMARTKLLAQYPAASWPLNRELSALLVALDAPEAVARTLDLRDRARTQEEQLHYQTVLRKAKSGWTPGLRQRYFAWFGPEAATAAHRTGAHPAAFETWFRDVGLEPGNGASFDNFVKNLRKESFEAVPDADKAPVAMLLAAKKAPAAATAPARTVVRDWKTADLIDAIGSLKSGRDLKRGREVYAAAQCSSCHRFQGEGGAVGPDLTGVGTRYAPVDVLKSLTEPSAVISEQYQNTAVSMRNGDEIVGRIVEDSPQKLVLIVDPIQGTRTEIRPADVSSRTASTVSPMPEGLLNTFHRDEILDLIAYLQADGKL
ncbi:MAG: c-type cytochrome [Verrucomicrobiales bacterium]|nr:c-type cytochrome [Verrucomicrobiales bacterium]